MFQILLTILSLGIFQYCDGARILGIVPTPSYSHQVLYWPLWKELSLKGHQLTVLTTDPMNDPSLKNLTEIDLHFTYNLWSNVSALAAKKEYVNPLKFIDMFFTVIGDIIDKELAHPEVKKIN